MINAERLQEICRFYDLLQTEVAESSAPLAMLQRLLLVNMMGELIAHAEETVAP